MSALILLVSVLSGTAPLAALEDREADLAAARALFERNIAAIQERDREAYLSCYRPDELLVRTSHEGSELGFDGLADGTPASASDEWPDELVARDLSLHWIAPGLVHGTYRYRVRFGAAVQEGMSTRLFRRDGDDWHIAVTAAFDAPGSVVAPPLALVGATLYDGNGGAPVPDAVVVTRNGRIEAAGPRQSTPVPEGIEVVELAGRFLVPGLIDTHVHYSQTGWADGRPDALDLRSEYPYEQVAAELQARPDRFHRAFLASGVTAVFDVGGFPWTRRLGEAAERSSLAPHVVATGPLLATWVPDPLRLPDRSQFVLIEDTEGVRRAVRSHAAAGSDAIKVWFIVRLPGDVESGVDLLKAAGEEARAQGLPLVVHATQLEAARVAVEAGATLLVHSVDDLPVDDAFVQLAVERGVFYCPTLTVGMGYEQLYLGELSLDLVHQLGRVHPDIAARVRRTPEAAAGLGGLAEQFGTRQRRRETTMAENLLTLHRAGVPIVAGTDAGNPLTLHGPSIVPELVAMQAAGMKPVEVLTAATRDAARALGRGHDLGLISVGHIADLVVLMLDPGRNVAHVGAIERVMRAGHLHDRELLLPR